MKLKYVVIAIIVIIATLVGFNHGNKKSETDYSSVKYVNSKLSEAMSNSEFKETDINKKKEICYEILDELEKQNYISDINYSSDTFMYEFKHSNGTLGGIMLDEFNKNYSGISKNNYSQMDSNNRVVSLNNKINFDTNGYPYNENNLKAKFMYGLGYPDVYADIKSRAELWSEEYLETTIDDYCTVEDFLNGLDRIQFYCY